MGLLAKTTLKQRHGDNHEAREAQNDSEKLIDPNSGIALEEQREILAQINGIAEQNRKSLSSGGEAARRRFKAKRHGGLFPVLVNLLGIAVLAGGFLALSMIQGEADAQAREGTRVFSPTERALIEEIRRETGGLLEAADLEIARLLSPLAELERQLRELPVVGADAGQAEERARLMAMREGLYEELELARQERSRILDESRARETALQVQFEERIREQAYEPAYAGPAAYTVAPTEAEIEAASALAYARAEFARLSDEQAQSAAVEAQINAFFTNAHWQIADGNFDGAERTVTALREFLNYPAFVYLRPVQARRAIYAQAADALEALLDERRASEAAMLADAMYAEARLHGEIAALERMLEERNGEIFAPAQDANDIEDPAVAELESANAQLQSANTQLQGANTQLQSTNTQLQSSVASLQSANATLAAQINTLQGDLSGQEQTAENMRQDAQELRDENDALSQLLAALQEQNETLYYQLFQIRETVRAMLQ